MPLPVDLHTGVLSWLHTPRFGIRHWKSRELPSSVRTSLTLTVQIDDSVKQMMMKRNVKLAVLAATLCLVCGAHNEGEEMDLAAIETQLWEHLMQSYRAQVAPMRRGGVKVQVGLVLTGMDISTATETMELSAWWRLYWRDHRSTPPHHLKAVRP